MNNKINLAQLNEYAVMAIKFGTQDAFIEIALSFANQAVQALAEATVKIEELEKQNENLLYTVMTLGGNDE